MKLVTDLSLTGRRLQTGAAFDPKQLFRHSRAGVWLDAASMTDLFQDDAGTVSVTEFGQSVGRITDRSGNGHDAWQAISGRRPRFARHPASGARNLLLHTNRFDLSPWSSVFTRTANAGTAPDGSETSTLVETTGAGQLIQPFVAGTAGAYTFSVYLKAGNAALSSSVFVIRNLTTATNCAFVNLSWATMSLTISSGTGAITAVADGWYRLVMTASAGFAPGQTLAAYAGSASSAGLTYWLWGAQVETGGTATPLQTVTSAADMTEPGQADVPHLLFDGIDDQLETDPINLSGAESLSLVAAATTNASGFIAEISADSVATDGGLALLHSGATTNDLTFIARTVSERERVSTPVIPAANRPWTFVASATANPQTSPRLTLQANGSEAGIRAGLLHPGSFANHRLYIGARAGGVGPMAGRLYGLVLLGSTVSSAVRTMAERHFNRRLSGESL